MQLGQFIQEYPSVEALLSSPILRLIEMLQQSGLCLGFRRFNTLRPRQNGRHFADDLFKCIFLNENVWIPIEISLKFVPKGSIKNNLT